MSGTTTSRVLSPPVLTDDFRTDVDRLLTGADTDLALRYPGDPGTRQSVHTVYVSAADADIRTPHRWGLRTLDLVVSGVVAHGTATVAAMIHTAGDRCIALHYGTFDYSAACGVAPDQQSLAHPVADHAKAVMQVAAAGTAVRVCDGSTNITPVGDPDQVRAAMRLHAQLVHRSLGRAYYQGWDMHPGHLATRYLATYAFYRSGLPAAATRLSNYLNQQASAAGYAGYVGLEYKPSGSTIDSLGWLPRTNRASRA